MPETFNLASLHKSELTKLNNAVVAEINKNPKSNQDLIAFLTQLRLLLRLNEQALENDSRWNTNLPEDYIRELIEKHQQFPWLQKV
jgi:hypothetical protein